MIQEFNITTEIDMILLFEELKSLSFYALFDKDRKFKTKADKITIFFTEDLNQDQQDELFLLIQNHQVNYLDHEKQKMHIEIDARTAELISNGYIYKEKAFSLSPNAQTNILALYSTKDEPEMIYPIRYNTIDDTDSYDLVDAADVKGMYLTALAFKKGFIDSGTALKDSVRAASTPEELTAIKDNR
jgi:hypothetical protein